MNINWRLWPWRISFHFFLHPLFLFLSVQNLSLRQSLMCSLKHCCFQLFSLLLNVDFNSHIDWFSSWMQCQRLIRYFHPTVLDDYSSVKRNSFLFAIPSVDTFWPSFLISVFIDVYITKRYWINFPLMLNSLIWVRLIDASIKDSFFIHEPTFDWLNDR